MDPQPAETTNKLLKVVIALMLRSKDEQPLTLRQRIEILAELGLKPIEISEIIGRTNTYVSKELVGIRKQQAKKE